MLITPWHLFKAALDERADVYHFHDPELIPAGLLLRVLRKQVVYDVHEELPKQILSKRCVAKIASAAERVSGRTFSAVVAATPAIGKQFHRKKTVIVQNFPDLSELASEDVRPYAERPPVVAYIGGIATDRGIKEIVHAITLIPESFGTRLLLAGNFDPPALEEEVKRIRGWERVDFVGWQSREGVARVLRISRVGLVLLHPLPNYLESYPIKLFEYMSAGIPVIASGFPLWRQIVEEAACGLLTDPLNPKAIAEAIQWLLEHEEEARAMGLRGRKAVHTGFNWNNESEKLLNLYRRISPACCGAVS
jgi:glycosyltransferase involved in cell wall biosynthesis